MSNPHEQRDAQHRAWGVVVANSNVKAAHIANGLVQLLRLYPDLTAAPLSLGGALADGFCGAYIKAAMDRLEGIYYGANNPHVGAPYDKGGWKLPKQALGFCVTHDKAGRLAFDPSESQPNDDKVMKPARLHAARHLAAPPDLVTHATLRRALNADERVYSTGGQDVTTPGLSFAGYTSTHTLASMHAVTALGLLSRTEQGREALGRLYALVERADDPHSSLVSALRVGNPPPARVPPSAPPSAPPYPLAGEDEGWLKAAEDAGRMFSRLLSWAEGRETKANTLMAVVDLVGLLSAARMLAWSEAEPVPLLSPAPPSRAHAALIAHAQRKLRAALAGLDERAAGAGLVKRGEKETYYPSAALKSLGQATGWVFPRDARGGAITYLRPGDRQLTTLVRALLEPSEEVSWEELRRRAWSLRLELGGAPRERESHPVYTKDIGALNQRHLVAIGLGRHESDNVVRVDGGGT
jgi:hypothetical protein